MIHLARTTDIATCHAIRHEVFVIGQDVPQALEVDGEDLKADFTHAVLGSQTHAIGFYERLGFTPFGPEYDDAGIPHRDMRRAL